MDLRWPGQCERPGLTFDPPSTCSFCTTIPPAAASSYLSFDLSSVASGPVPRSHIHLILILSISRCFSAAVAIQRRPCLPIAYKRNMAPSEFLLAGQINFHFVPLFLASGGKGILCPRLASGYSFLRRWFEFRENSICSIIK